MALINLHVRMQELEGLVQELQATDKQMSKALRSTVARLARWVRTRSLRGLSKELQVQQKIIRRRLKTIKVRSLKNGGSITLWYGLDPVALIYLNARQNQAGVRAAGQQYQSAFIARARNGRAQVFKREGWARLPIKKQSLEIEEKAESYLERHIVQARAFEAQFFKTFEHELKWQTRTPA